MTTRGRSGIVIALHPTIGVLPIHGLLILLDQKDFDHLGSGEIKGVHQQPDFNTKKQNAGSKQAVQTSSCLFEHTDLGIVPLIPAPGEKADDILRHAGVKIASAATAVMPDAVVTERDLLPVKRNPGFAIALVEVERPVVNGLEAERVIIAMEIVNRLPIYEDFSREV
jgi:hypothetical protein